MIFFAAVGVILGGRLGWILFYGIEGSAGGSADDPAHLGRRHVVPRRPARRADRGCNFCRAAAGASIADVLDFLAPLPGPGHPRRPHRQLHQRRAVGQADRRAVGLHRRSGRAASDAGGRGAAPVRALLRSIRACCTFTPRSSTKGCSKGCCCSSILWVFTAQAAAAACAVRAVSALLRRVPFRRGIRARAGRESRLPAVRLGDDGPDPVARR